MQEQRRSEHFHKTLMTTTADMAGISPAGNLSSFVTAAAVEPGSPAPGEVRLSGLVDQANVDLMTASAPQQAGPAKALVDRPPPVPLMVLKRPETTRPALLRMCSLRKLSHEPSASKERLVRLLTEDLLNSENGLNGHAQDYYAFLSGRVAEQPHLLNFQVAVLPPSRAPAQHPKEASASSNDVHSTHGGQRERRDSLSADAVPSSWEVEAKISELVGGDADSLAVPAFRAAFRQLHQGKMRDAQMHELTDKMNDMMGAIEDARGDAQRGFQDVLSRVGAGMCHEKGKLPATDDKSGFKAKKRRLRDVVADAASTVRRDGHASAIQADQAAVMGTLPIATTEDLCADTFKLAAEIISDMPKNASLVVALNHIIGLCHTQWGEKGLFGTLAVVRAYTAWSTRVASTGVNGKALINAALTNALKNTVARVEGILRVLVFIDGCIPGILGPGPCGGRTARAAQELALKEPAQTTLLHTKIQELGDELGGAAVELSRKGPKLTYSDLRVRLLQRVAKKHTQALSVGPQSRPSGIQTTPLVRPWIDFVVSSMPRRYGSASSAS